MSDLEGLKAFQIMLLFQRKVINKQIPPLKLRRCYISCPSVLHRYSIETMEHVWSIYGVCMEYLRRKNRPKEKENPLLQALKTKCLKAKRRGVWRIQNPTPPRWINLEMGTFPKIQLCAKDRDMAQWCHLVEPRNTSLVLNQIL